MPIQELDELFARVTSPEDKAQLEQIFTRNESALEYAKSGTELYSAFIDGNRDAIARLEAKPKPTIQNSMTITPTPPPATPGVSSPALDMSKVDELVEAKTRALFDQLLKTDTFNTTVKGLVKTTADELAPGMYAVSSRNANEIYDIRRANEREFNQPLDMTKFDEFLTKNTGKFATLTDSYNAFVNEDRISARITKGVADGILAERAKETPGNTLGKGTTMADRFVAINKTKMDNTRGESLDQAAAAFRRMQSQRVE